ncbi:hypothetical protein JAAARDRAFT_35765 [Jaapia argillacea MUCL 33604]|uniref:Uncharacterized protein n=1 Tax=Jaapia argillacea MUCL 33604 TaxID=933084 RepID=A0A067PTJ3_9AGAM|nr:hypothetical protein JAAARDRAFT_35765 [Jaapia argillacea MUCL 33604]
MFSLASLLFSVCLLLELTDAFQNVTLTSHDLRINYVGEWADEDGGSHRFTTTVRSSLSLTFQGSAVYWYAAINPSGASANVSIYDGPSSDLTYLRYSSLVEASAGATIGEQPLPGLLFYATDLVAPETTVNISFVGLGALGGSSMEIYSLEYTPNIKHSMLDEATLIGVAAAGAVVAAGIVSGIVFYIRRRRRTAKKIAMLMPYISKTSISPSPPPTPPKTSLGRQTWSTSPVAIALSALEPDMPSAELHIRTHGFHLHQ